MSSDPDKIPAVNLAAQYASIRDEVREAVDRVLERQNFVLGEQCVQLEREVAALQGCEDAVGCASGTDAILLSLLALGIGPGDAVIVPPLTFFATASMVDYVGARPVFADIDPRTFNISPTAVEATLADPELAGRVKAILPVHLYGQCADMDPLMKLAGSRELSVIEDAAQAICARYRGIPAGSIGITGCFSFYPTKNLGAAGDGGIISTRDATLGDRLRQLRSHGSRDRLTYPEVGINSRLDTLQAAILLVKMRHIGEWTEARGARASDYRRLFAEVFSPCGRLDPGAVYPTTDAPVVLPHEERAGEHVYHQFTVRVQRRGELMEHLRDRGIETTVYYPVALHQQPAFSATARDSDTCPEAARAAAEVLSLPIYPELTAGQQERVVRAIFNFYR